MTEKKPMSPKMKAALAKLAALPPESRKKMAKVAKTRMALAELGRNPMVPFQQSEQ